MKLGEKFMREDSKCEKMIKWKKIFNKFILLISIIMVFILIYVKIFKPLKINKNNNHGVKPWLKFSFYKFLFVV